MSFRWQVVRLLVKQCLALQIYFRLPLSCKYNQIFRLVFILKPSECQCQVRRGEGTSVLESWKTSPAHLLFWSQEWLTLLTHSPCPPLNFGGKKASISFIWAPPVSLPILSESPKTLELLAVTSFLNFNKEWGICSFVYSCKACLEIIYYEYVIKEVEARHSRTSKEMKDNSLELAVRWENDKKKSYMTTHMHTLVEKAMASGNHLVQRGGLGHGQ